MKFENENREKQHDSGNIKPDFNFTASAPVSLDCPALRTLSKLLLAWIVISDEYGKPSPELVEDFLIAFQRFLNRRSFKISRELKENYDANFNNESYKFTGGFAFYVDLDDFLRQYKGRDYKAATREFIQNWNPKN